MTNHQILKVSGLKPLLCAAAPNRFSSCSILLQSDQTTFIVFGAGQQIAIWRAGSQFGYFPLELLQGHKSTVGVIKSLNCPIGDTFGFVSGDVNGKVLVWKQDASGNKWKIVVCLDGHERSISSLSAIRLSDFNQPFFPGGTERYLIVAGASDGRLICWEVSLSSSTGALQTSQVTQILELGNQIALDVALSFLPNQSTDLIMALATTTCKILTYSARLPSLSFGSCFHLPGHTDWIRCLDFVQDPTNPRDLLLASGSQDNFIRLWRCQEQVLAHTQAPFKKPAALSHEDLFEKLDELTHTLKEENKLGENSTELKSGSNPLTVQMKRYSINNTPWSFLSEAVLYGHEGWVTNVHWSISPNGSLQLLSASSDRSIIIWKPSQAFDGVWLNSERFGESGTSINLSFFGAHYCFGNKDRSDTVYASGWTGAWHCWTRKDATLWEPLIAPTGHDGPVTGLEWDKEGEYVLSCSSDQTTRLWGHWRPSNESNESEASKSWHEICRPQVHGHDMFGVSFIDDRRSRFISIAEEKVMRVFEMTEDFVKMVERLDITKVPFAKGHAQRAQRAVVPPLGLSNRIDDLEQNSGQKLQLEAQQSCPPFEDQLLTKTLWPEVDKIYGHPSELSSIAVSHSGQIIASACNANSAQTASIRLYTTENGFGPIGSSPLEAHQLTVTRLAFSPDDSKLVSVSRDRSWSVWKQLPDGSFDLEQRMEKAHSRIIWDACWAPHETKMFISGSRDKSVKFWLQTKDESSWNLADIIQLDQPVKACTASPHLLLNKMMLLAVGLEDGTIGFYTSTKANRWGRIENLELISLYHSSPVTRLAFAPTRPQIETEDLIKVRLASGGEDGVIKITELNLGYDG
ncbi:hypothetical protein O181_003422 [Austropuccinia psidii MF-1]|uniref:Elongator complex protein 2 n=1 Tax=Austropuccinia psidii MF-1 TaxID=1389203 RepID=A0A9Q3GEW5_9BASI|nr:hypothetical protein [Austropuccinia psidii MF-1]